MLKDLKDLAAKQNVPMPTDLSLNALNIQAELESSPSSEVFDSYYINAMRTFQREQLNDFQAQSQYARDAGIQNFTRQYLPMIQISTTEVDRIYAMVENHTTKARPKP
jgi:predicted outer membrane protein